MKYQYQCRTCSAAFDTDFSLGKAEPTVRCKCGGSAKRVFSAVSFAVRGGNVSTERTFGQEMLRRNRDAEKRMKGNKPPVRRVATDFGGGRIEEVGR